MDSNKLCWLLTLSKDERKRVPMPIASIKLRSVSQGTNVVDEDLDPILRSVIALTGAQNLLP